MVHKIEGTQDAVGGLGQQMPNGQDPLSALEREGIRGWINGGAPKN